MRKLPEHLRGEDDAIFRSSTKAIIDATAPCCVAYKATWLSTSMGVVAWWPSER